MLLSSPSFSNFLDNLSANPAALAPQTAPVKVEQRQEHQRQVPKDVNPHAAAQQLSQQQIGMAMIPEQSVDFSMLGLDNDSFNFQPQVFAVLETPEVPTVIDTSILSGKASNFVGEHFDSDDEKIEIPTIDRPLEKTTAPQAPEVPPVDEEFENDPEFALYHTSPTQSTEESDEVAPASIFGGVEPEKILARYELVDASEEEQSALLAMSRVQRIASSLDIVMARLEKLTM